MRSILCGTLVALALAPSVMAQTSTPIDRDRIDRNGPVPSDRGPTARPVDKDLPAAAIRVDAVEQPAVPIATIKFQGTDVPRIVALAAQRFVGKPASKPVLQQLVAAMSQAYGRSPVALFTIVIPDQDLSGGTVSVFVAEGYVEAVILGGEVKGRALKLVKAYADPLTKQRPTSRRTMERQISLIRDIPGLKVDARLETGGGQGAVRLILTLDYQRPTVTFSFDNRTTRLVRDGQIQGNAKLYGLLREGDLTEINAAASVDLHDYVYAGITHSTPIGHDGIRLAGSVGYLETRPNKTLIRGKAKTAALSVSWPVIRGYNRNLTISAGIDGIDNDNAALGTLIASERTRAARLAAGYGQARGRLSLSGSLAFSRGLDMLGAHIANGFADQRFTKVNGRVGVERTLGKRTTLRLNASGQWTRDLLPAVESFSVGGPDFGRAFDTALLSADRGVAGLAELAWRPVGKGRFARTELYSFVDGADVTFLPRGAFTGLDLDLASAGAGVRLAWNDKARLELEAARPINDPYAGYDAGWRFSVGWRLSLKP